MGKECTFVLTKQQQNIMKATLKPFRIWIITSHGLGCFTIKANNFSDAYKRLSKKYKSQLGWIDDEDGESMTFNEISNNLLIE